MLVDLPPHYEQLRDPFSLQLLTVMEREMPSSMHQSTYERLGTGIYRGHLNVHNDLRALIKDRYPRWPDLPRDEEPSCYGVCDTPEQIVAKWPQIDADQRPFTIFVVPVIRDEEPESGGWRWHKWGAYIGDREPQCEYLHDEPEIGKVYVFYIYEMRS